MKVNLTLTDEEFAKRFENCSLSPDLFDHEAHLRLAWIHLKKFGLEGAISSVTDQLMVFVNHLNAQDKYNHTLSVTGVKMVHHFMQKSESQDFNTFLEEFPRLITNFRELVSAHYSFDIYNSQDAKSTYLEPDLAPFM